MLLLRKRITAFMFDMLLVVFLTVCLSNLNYLNPYKYDYEKANKELATIYKEVSSSMTDSNSSSYLDAKELNNTIKKDIIPIVKKVEKYNFFYFAWYLIIYYLYFVIFVYYNDGQTVFKKISKIKVVTDKGKRASILNLSIRSIFNGSNFYLGLNFTIIVRLILSFINNNNVFYYSYTLIELFALIFEISLVVLLFINKGTKSTHDLIASTKVIEAK